MSRLHRFAAHKEKLKSDTQLSQAGPAGGGPVLSGAPSASAIPSARRLRVSLSCRLPPFVVATHALYVACMKWYALAVGLGLGFWFLNYRVSRLTRRADGFIVGAQSPERAKGV